ncbi:MAG: MoaD/ThiS family protein [Desulfatitalea sp.]|nr:MoaD/ThiS family protein [Desulfatitalea sp.]NNK01356.1 MoaD/ThiS family protein [Desulfatitalea sp.]
MHTRLTTIDIRLFATLSRFQPPDATHYPVEPSITVGELLSRMGVPLTEVKLIFINGVKGSPETALNGGERVGIFPPVGGG